MFVWHGRRPQDVRLKASTESNNAKILKNMTPKPLTHSLPQRPQIWLALMIKFCVIKILYDKIYFLGFFSVIKKFTCGY